jgi:hypothetical protein
VCGRCRDGISNPTRKAPLQTDPLPDRPFHERLALAEARALVAAAVPGANPPERLDLLATIRAALATDRRRR